MKETLHLVVFGLALLCLNIELVGTSSTDAQDVDVLNAIREVFNLSGWTGNPCDPPLSWIRCSSANPARVVHVDLTNSNLSGAIPSNFTSLTELKDLWLGNNPNLTGPLPDLSTLTNLQSLRLGSIGLTGAVPAILVKLQHLVELEVDGNHFIGSLPNLSNLKNLTLLQINQSSLNGSFPASIISQMASLKWLYADNNYFTGSVPDLSSLSELQLVMLDNNGLSGELPDPSSWNSKNISYLSISNNNLSGSLPDFSPFSNLSLLHLDDNKLTGQIPQSLFQIKTLQFLSLANNSFNGSIPDPGALENLQLLFIYQCNLIGSIPDNLSQLSTLKYLALRDNFLTGAVPDLSNLTSLQYLFLQDNQLSGPMPKLPGNIYQFWLGNNKFSGPVELPSFSFVSKYDLSMNLFTGPLPTLKNTYDVLQELHLNNNSFNGSIPAGYGQYSNLELLFLANNQLEGTIPDFSGSQKLQEVHLSYNLLSGTIPSTLGELINLKELSLDNNMLEGPIPSSLGGLVNLTILNLQNNRLSGAVPANLANLSNLQELHLDNNNFSSIPLSLAQKPGLNITYSNNPHITLGEGPSSNGPTNSSHGSSNIGVIVGVIVAVIVIGIFVILVIVFRRRKRKRRQALLLNPHMSKEDLPKSALSFSLKEVRAITSNYKKMIGKGGYGPVYYGRLPTGEEVAVKVKAANSKQGVVEFFNEVVLLSKLHHKNIVPLVGYCMESDQQILLYPFMPLGTLHEHLYASGKTDDGIGKRKVLDWNTRMDIAVNAAKGLEYLHKSCTPPIIHRDIKSNNILLTEKMQAKVGDLGISKAAPEDNPSGVSTAIKGTFGYLDPEYFMQRRLTPKSDVFSFGMVLFELITGKQPQSLSFPDSTESNVRDWVEAAMMMKNVQAVVDPALGGAYDVEGLWMVAELAVACTGIKGADRPEMGEVVRSLQGALGNHGRSPMALEIDHDEVPFSGQLSMPPFGDTLPFSTSSTSTSLPSSSKEVSWSKAEPR